MLGDLEFSSTSVNHRHLQTDTFAPLATFAFLSASTRDTFPIPTHNTAPTPTPIKHKKTTNHFRPRLKMDLDRSTLRQWPELKKTAISFSR
jgi:hypothetical protein